MNHCPGALQHVLFSSELFAFVPVACGIGLCSKSAVSLLYHVGSNAPCFASLQRYHSFPGVHHYNLVYVIYVLQLLVQSAVEQSYSQSSLLHLPHFLLVVNCGSLVRGMFCILMLITLSLSATVALNILHCNNSLTMSSWLLLLAQSAVEHHRADCSICRRFLLSLLAQ